MNDRPPHIVPTPAKPADSNNQAGPATAAPEGDPNDQEKLDELRHLLLAPEQQQLAQLQTRLDDHQSRVRDLSRTLPAAIKARNAQDEALTVALAPNIGPALRRAIKEDSSAVIEAVTPVIGPAIRQAITKAFNEFVQSVDETMKYSLSAQGLKWRVEAWTTGRSFAEVVMYHTLVYRVEQVFLFHKKTGLPLEHVAERAAEKDPDMISGLLAAINDFARESFRPAEEQTLMKLDYGKLEVWIEGGTPPVDLAYLAAVINGNAPEGLRTEVLLPALEEIHSKQRAALLNFDGDTSPFVASRPQLEACLTAQYRGKSPVTEAPRGFRLPPSVAVPLVLLLLLLATRGFFIWRAQRNWNGYLAKLRAEPGLVVTEQGRRGGVFFGARFFVEGLRDPLAADPEQLLRQTPLSPAAVTSLWQPYHSLDPAFVQARAARVLEPPAGVKLRIEEGTLYLSGQTAQQWVANARQLARALPGVTRLDESGLLTAEAQEQNQIKAELERAALRFVKGQTQLAAGQTAVLRALTDKLRRLFALAAVTGKQPQLEITGHTDSKGGEEVNQRLSLARAESVKQALAAQGLPRAQIVASGVSNQAPLRTESTDEDKQLNRRVSFRIVLR